MSLSGNATGAGKEEKESETVEFSGGENEKNIVTNMMPKYCRCINKLKNERN